MAIRAGQFLTYSNNFLVERIQQGGVNNLNIPQETIAELGNFLTVAVVRDIPDLSFDITTLDPTTDIEATLLNLDPASIGSGQVLDFMNARPIDVVSPFKAGQFLYNTVGGVVVPCLTLEQVEYRYGVKQNSQEVFTLRGDSIYYVPGTPYMDTFTGGGTTHSFVHGPARQFLDEGNSVYALGVSWVDNTTGLFKRLFHGTDYTDDANGLTLLAAPPGTATVRVLYGSATSRTIAQNVHSTASQKPAAIRSKDIDVYISNGAATPTIGRFSGVQTFQVTRRVNLENEEEFGNRHYLSSDYDTAAVSGQMGVKAVDVQTFTSQLQQLAGITDPTQIVGPNTGNPLQVEVHINDPITGARIKTVYISDARFEPPPVLGRVNQKLDITIKFTSDTGALQVSKGTFPGLA